MTARSGVHFCGSIQLPENSEDSTEQVFKILSAALSDRLLRLPDGEIGVRSTFCGWQIPVLLKTLWIVADFTLQMVGMKSGDYPPGNVEDIELGDVQYDDYAISSYQKFAELKQAEQFRAKVEPMYEKLLLKALENIQAQIPHDELAVQWDCPIEVLFLNGLTFPFAPHFNCNIDSIVPKIKRLASAVSKNVQMEFHLCYGDFENRHIMDPRDMSLMVQLTNALLGKVQRPVNWIHMPVPIDRKDEAYFSALRNLNLSDRPETEVYLGLVHANDLDGTQERVLMAQAVVPNLKFGVATECGLGRKPKSDIPSILEISKTVSTPILLAST